MLNEKVKGIGTLHLVLTDENGVIVKEETKTNLIVDAGLALTAGLLIGEAVDPISHIAIGTSTQAVAAEDTALIGTELARVAPVITRTDNAVSLVATFGAGVGTGTIEEAGVLNAAAVGTLYSRALTGSYVKAAGYALGITWTITWSVAA